MSDFTKGQGGKIAIKFTNELIEDVTGYTPTPVGGLISSNVPIELVSHVASASDYLSNRLPSDVFDNNLETFMMSMSSSPIWLQIELENQIIMSKFRWYVSSAAYPPKDFTLLASNDGIDFVSLFTGVSPNITGWHEFIIENNNTAYKFYRWNITSKWSTYLRIYDINLYSFSPIGNEIAFKVLGQQKKHIEGNLINGDYQVDKVEKHPTEINTILLTMKPLNRFNNVEGDITVEYDASKGNLKGTDGLIESFSIPFLPTSLLPIPNPHVAEKITVGIGNVNADFKKVNYNRAYGDEKITVNMNVSAVFTYVGVINP